MPPEKTLEVNGSTRGLWGFLQFRFGLRTELALLRSECDVFILLRSGKKGTLSCPDRSPCGFSTSESDSDSAGSPERGSEPLPAPPGRRSDSILGSGSVSDSDSESSGPSGRFHGPTHVVHRARVFGPVMKNTKLTGRSTGGEPPVFGDVQGPAAAIERTSGRVENFHIAVILVVRTDIVHEFGGVAFCSDRATTSLIALGGSSAPRRLLPRVRPRFDLFES